MDAKTIKTICIDEEAFDHLTARRLNGESVSETIKRLIPKPFDVEAWFRKIAENPMSDEALDAVEQQVAQRGAPQNREDSYDLPGHELSYRPRAGAEAEPAGAGGGKAAAADRRG